MTWTEQRPTEPGWYWLWTGWDIDPFEVVRITAWDGSMQRAGCDSEEYAIGRWWPQGSLFFGPLEPPELPKEDDDGKKEGVRH